MNRARPTSHPSPDILQAFGLGQLNPLEQAEIERHIAGCDECCQALQEVPDDTLVERLQKDNTPPDATAAWPSATAPGPAKSPAVRGIPKELLDHPRYRIVRQLGVGGMGVVYEAEHRIMERPVALKVINRRLINNPEAIQRFRLEVKTAARLSHQNIVTAHDADQAGDLHFLVMEYVDGVSLAHQVSKGGPLPIMHACNFIRQAALGLQHASDKGMVHRDIKPHNLMLTRNLRIKILDFGLSRFVLESGADEMAIDGSANATGDTASLTAVGAALGTPDYIAPEQASDSRRADIRSDIYSLGCTFYYLLAGQTPFPKGSATERILAHMSKPPQPVRELRPQIPAEVAAILERMMAKDPSDRFQKPADVAAALQPFSKPAGAPEPVSSPSVETSAPALGLPADILADLPPLDQFPAADWLTPLPAPSVPTTSPLDDALRQGRKLIRRHGRSLAIAGAGVLVLAIAWLAWPAVRRGIESAAKSMSTDETASSRPVDPTPSPSKTQPDLPRAIPDSSPVPSTSGNISPPRPAATFNPRILLVVPQKNFWFKDYVNVREPLKWKAKANVTVASSQRGFCEPANDNRIGTSQVTAEISLSEANPSDYDAVIFIGANPLAAADFLTDTRQRSVAQAFMNKMLGNGKWVVGICGGNAFLADAGILRGQPAAGNQYIPKSVLSASGAEWDYSSPVVTAGSGRILTGHDESAGPKLVEELLRQMSRGG